MTKQLLATYLETEKTEPDFEAISALPKECSFTFKKEKVLRGGENPHQQAALYGSFSEYYEQLQGKELSYNNILDITAATYSIGEFEKPTESIKSLCSEVIIAPEFTREALELLTAKKKSLPNAG